MPIYQCKPGADSTEPWRHGVPVYALPFPLPIDSHSQQPQHDNVSSIENYGGLGGGSHNNSSPDRNVHSNTSINAPQMHQYEDEQTRYTTHTLAGGTPSSATRPSASPTSENAISTHHNTTTLSTPLPGSALPIRRVKHAEIVLVDEVSIYYGYYWLRLRWPGTKGGVAGYIALGSVNDEHQDDNKRKNNEELKKELEKNLNRRGTDTDNSGSCDDNDGGVNYVLDGGLLVGAGGYDDDDTDHNNNKHHNKKDLIHSSKNLRQERSRPIGINDVSVQSVTNNLSFNSDQEPSIPEDDDEEDDANSIDLPAIDPTEAQRPKCERTGLYFPSTAAMELLALYNDGLTPSSQLLQHDSAIIDDLDGGLNGVGEPVFCRICREGLHDIDYDFEMEGGKEKADDDVNNSNINRDQDLIRVIDQTNTTRRSSRLHNRQSQTDSQVQNRSLNNYDSLQHDHQEEANAEDIHSSSCNQLITKQHDPSVPMKAEDVNNPYAANPLLSPCECAGSMAFVHYLCIEQWRCRSHHPSAKNGLNCETCNAPYTLPPPPSRPEHEYDDWIEAMPQHVLAALRNPHPFWQIGAAIVRRRWLRPIAPVLTSPIVALYCRARRSLKKRGVSRRRWACSLCRRRARWKCVRCLRSYYCSRQCQNVSWHIVHKHVCYKPSRFWQSVVVYGLAYVYFIPGVVRHPFIHDIGLGFLWLSFILHSFIGGGIATLMKREMGIDIRGRSLECIVVLFTLWTGVVCWGLVWGFFGEPDQCTGFTGKVGNAIYSLFPEQRIIQNLVLKPTQTVINKIDQVLLKTGPRITSWICNANDENSSNETTSTCLEAARKMNPDFMSPDYNGEKCSSDFGFIKSLLYFAGFIHILCTVWKRNHRGRRVRHHHHPRPHQD